jgi:hypothetical protein
MFPPGHAQCKDADTFSILEQKIKNLGLLGLGKDGLANLLDKLNNIEKLTNEEV